MGKRLWFYSVLWSLHNCEQDAWESHHNVAVWRSIRKCSGHCHYLSSIILDKRFWLRLIMRNAVVHTVLGEVRFSYEHFFQILKGALWGDGDVGLTKVIGKRPRIRTLKLCNQHTLDHLVTGLVQSRCDISLLITYRRLCADVKNEAECSQVWVTITGGHASTIAG